MFQKPLNIDEMIFDMEIVLTALKSYILPTFMNTLNIPILQRVDPSFYRGEVRISIEIGQEIHKETVSQKINLASVTPHCI